MSAHSEYIANIRKRVKQISAELEHLNGILALEDEEPTMPETNKNPVSRTTKKEKAQAEGLSKTDDLSWDDYVKEVLKQIGNKGKTNDVVKYMTKANPKMKPGTILASARHHLSKLQRSGIIGAHKGKSRAAGYEYYIKSDAPLFEKAA